jgi:hypothetical protein
VGGGVQTGSTRHVGHFWPIVPAPGDCEDVEFGGIQIGRENRSTRRKPAPAPLCIPQIPLDQIRARTLAAAVGSQRLTAWAMEQPLTKLRTDVQMFWRGNQVHRIVTKKQNFLLRLDNSIIRCYGNPNIYVYIIWIAIVWIWLIGWVDIWTLDR